MTNYKGIEKVIVFGHSEIVNKRMPLFTIQQRYKYYFSCCIFLYKCVFILVRFFLMRYIHMRFFSGALFSYVLFFGALFSGHHKFIACNFYACI